MALSDSYASLTELKARLGHDDAVDDPQLITALAVASRGIDKVCDRQFNDAGVVTARVYRPRGRTLVDVDDVHTVTGLVVATDDNDDGVYEVSWASSDYQLEPLNGVVDGEIGWPWYRLRAVGSFVFPSSTRPTLQLTARWGWAAVPAAVKEATLVLAEDVFKLRDTPFGVGGFGEFGRIRARENPHVAMLIGRYQRYPHKLA